ncbi:MAG: carbohydrate ABC transporter permease [Lautropia sp.]
MLAASRWKWATLAPALLVYGLLALLPIVNLAVMSVHDIRWEQGRAFWTFVGGSHFRALADDELLIKGLANTSLFALLAVGAEMLLGFFLAVLVSGVARGRVFYQTALMMPILLPGIVIGAIWKLMYNPDFGVINAVLGAFGLAGRDWLGDPSLAFLSVVVVDVWHWTPFVFLLLLAALESLPAELYEAARVDGASRWQELTRITLPLMWPAIVVTMVFRLIVSFKVFDEVYLLTGGGPGTTTEVLSFTVYRRFFTEDRVGYGSAVSILAVFLVTLMVVVSLAAGRRRR